MEGVKVEKATNPTPKNPNRYYRGSVIATSTTKAETTFQGRCEDLRGHVFDCAVRKEVDRYTVTIKEMAENIGINFTYGADIRQSLEHKEEFMVPKPISLDATADAIDKRIWEKEIGVIPHPRAMHRLP
jgi:hypothetical protein